MITNSSKRHFTVEDIHKFHFGPNLDPEGKKKVLSVLENNSNAFAWNDKDLTGIVDEHGKLIKAKVELTNYEPVNIRPYRTSPEAAKIIEEHFMKEEKNGWVEKSKSPYGAPSVLAPKKNAALRVCYDYRLVNKRCKTWRFPIPDLHASLDKFSGAKWFSTLDAQDAFKQVWLDEESREILAVNTNQGKYQPCRLPFGFKNSGTIYQAIVNRLLALYKLPYLVNYVDDNAIHAETLDQMCDRLDEVLKVMIKHNIKLKPSKCSFALNELAFLGHVVTPEGIKIDQSRVENINKWPVPKDGTDVRSFLGFVGFFQRHIWRMAEMAAPLHLLLEKDREFAWNQDQKIAFKQIKRAMANAPVLTYPKAGTDIEIFCDGCDYAIGGVIFQRENKVRKPMAFFSEKLNGPQLNWTVTHKECYAVVRAVEKFRHYIWFRQVKVFTDHSSLKWLLETKHPNARLMR